MPSEDTAKTAASSKDTAPKRATLEQLRAKKRKQKEIPFVINDEEVTFLFRAISAKDYDRLLTDCPPTLDQRANGSSYDVNKFGPKLISRVIIEPELPEEVWGEFWVSPDWNRGELLALFSECVEICNSALPLGPTALV